MPWLALTEAGHAVTVASVTGAEVPLDPRSVPTGDKAAAWSRPLAALAGPPAFDMLPEADFDAVFLPGGHGTMFDMPFNRRLHDLLFRFDESGRLIAAICHAPAVFVGMRRPDGTPFIAGRKIAAFTDAEERSGHSEANVPFLLETRLKELGAWHVAAGTFASHTVADGRLLTGQNPQSSAQLAGLVLARLRS
ncbi:type 1 glutamine amidotransferase domain-containing protein [Methylobrevis albus]|uniref:Type 1 glutamine amidotransferase domain-containing protein n=1 Tax=Methylobrevis albus TaxID=2793297 RepID=A0A931MZC5_9HYPH|nr:type 1 glutamine amidotransferase domain-containing protein [Methylobrevis albus]MBH0237909.1 type 1 glutamine amidotransferase domain-containing protein [Methylobrevis albus]